MMKYRIIERRGMFYPQYRFLVLWFHFTEVVWADLCGFVDDEVYFSNHAEAEKYIKSQASKITEVHS